MFRVFSSTISHSSRPRSTQVHRKVQTLSKSFFSASSVVLKRSNIVHASLSIDTRRAHFVREKVRCFSTKDDSSKTTINDLDLSSPDCNVTPTILSRVGTNLHQQAKHPLNTIKTIIEQYWQKRNGFITHDNLNPIVKTIHNFDSLLIPPDHVSRSKSDTYYVDKESVLRTHTSAHQTTMLKAGHDRFLVTGDVYR